MDVATRVDVIVIGAGPAGSAAARLLALWGHDVALIGRSAARHAMAESLPPSCVKLFDTIRVRDVVDAAGFVRATGNTVRWAGSERRIEKFDDAVPGYQVARDAFDAVLAAAARSAGAQVVPDANVRAVERRGNEHVASYESGAARGEFIAPMMFDCSGRAGVVARRGLRRGEPEARTTAVVAVWERPGGWPIDEPTHTLVESFEGGWAWSVPVSETRRYVTVMLDPTRTPLPGRDQLTNAYLAELARAPMLAELVSNATMVEAPWGCDASPYSAERVSDDGMLLVGDAASFVDPLSSFGVKKALASAWLAAVVAHTALGDAAVAPHAMALFERREREMYEQLQRQSAALSRDAAGVHESSFWHARASSAFESSGDDLDAGALRTDPRVLGAFDDLRSRPAISLRVNESVQIVDRPTVRGNRVVLDRHLVAPNVPAGARFCRNVDLYVICQLAGSYQQVPDLFEAYNRAAPPAPLPDFLGALSTLIGLEVLSFA